MTTAVDGVVVVIGGLAGRSQDEGSHGQEVWGSTLRTINREVDKVSLPYVSQSMGAPTKKNR
jgi:hypothetical protein